MYTNICENKLPVGLQVTQDRSTQTTSFDHDAINPPVAVIVTRPPTGNLKVNSYIKEKLQPRFPGFLEKNNKEECIRTHRVLECGKELLEPSALGKAFLCVREESALLETHQGCSMEDG